jgi:zinc transporter, ZIP family
MVGTISRGPHPPAGLSCAAVMAAALGWGALAASSLVIGALLGLARRWPERVIGLVLAFGAGALVSAVSFDLFEEGVAIGGAGWVAVGLAAGAITYFMADRTLELRRAARGGAAGTALALGAFLDGIPEQMVLGIGLATGEGVSVGLLMAIFVSNLPEAIGSASEMKEAGSSGPQIRRLWIVVAALCALATVLGYGLADAVEDRFKAFIDGFAAGALLVMLIDTMIPDGTAKAGRAAGLVTTLGFALAAGISTVS